MNAYDYTAEAANRRDRRNRPTVRCETLPTCPAAARRSNALATAAAEMLHAADALQAALGCTPTVLRAYQAAVNAAAAADAVGCMRIALQRYEACAALL